LNVYVVLFCSSTKITKSFVNGFWCIFAEVTLGGSAIRV